MDTIEHQKDSDCTVHEDGCCIVCGVSHWGPPCTVCGATAFHIDGCSEIEDVGELTLEDVHKICGGVAIEPVKGGWRVTTTAGSVCGETREDALAGALLKFEEEGL